MSQSGGAQFTPGPWVVNTFMVNGQHKLEVLDATGANACVQAWEYEKEGMGLQYNYGQQAADAEYKRNLQMWKDTNFVCQYS